MNLLTNFKQVLALVVLSIITVGCTTQTPQQQAAESHTEALQEDRENELDVTPSWFISPPVADETGFYGVGYAHSKHLGHAVKSAKLQAEFELAKMYKQELSGSERAYEKGTDDGDVVTQTTFLIDKIVEAVPVVGYSVVDQKITPVAGVYEVFVQLKLPYDEFNRVLKSQKAGEVDTKVKAAFDDLERRLNKRRKQKSPLTAAQS